MTRASAPVAALVLTVFVVLTAVAGCSDTDSDAEDTDKPIGALTSEQIATAVLQPENLGDGWESEPATKDEGSTAPGCLADLEALTDQLEAEEQGGTEFTFGEVLTVESTVSAYADETQIEAIFDQVQTVAAACAGVTGTDDDGNEWNLTLTTSDDAVYDDVDDQYSVSGSGTLTTPSGADVQVHIETTAVRLGPNVASVSTFDFEERTTEHRAWTEIAIERFVDVAEGEEPGSETAPAPGAAA